MVACFTGHCYWRVNSPLFPLAGIRCNYEAPELLLWSKYGQVHLWISTEHHLQGKRPPTFRYFPVSTERLPLSGFSFFYVHIKVTLPARLPKAGFIRSRKKKSVNHRVFVSQFFPSPRPDPFLSRLLPEPPSSSLPVLHHPRPASPPPNAPLALRRPGEAFTGS